MKQKLILSLLCVLAVFALTSCDSLWRHRNKEAVDISFSISKSALEELFASDSMKTVSHTASDSKNSVLRSINLGNNGIEMTISIHAAFTDSIIARKTQVVHKDEIVRFENLMVVGSTVYAKIVLVQNGVTKEGRSETIRAEAGKNVITVGNFINIHLADYTLSASDMAFKVIQGGTFTMGDNDSGQAKESPERLVTVDSFYLGETEITQRQWLAVMSEWPGKDEEISPGVYKVPSEEWGLGNDRPAYYINWYDVIEFCNALSEEEGLTPFYTVSGNTVIVDDWKANGYRLPTEAEWEYAAGGAQATPTKWAGTDDENELEEYAVYGGTSEGVTSSATVKGKKPNALGLYGMSGNVDEWCWDWYADGYYNQSNNTDNPTGPTSGTFRVLRGGHWNQFATNSRVANRSFFGPTTRSYHGIRVARNAN